MTNRLQIAVVALTHLNKGCGGGSQNARPQSVRWINAFIAAARAAFAVIEDTEREGRGLFLQVKNNLGPPCRGLAFRMEQRLVADRIVSSNGTFGRAHMSQSVDEALTDSQKRRSDGSQTSGNKDVTAFLTELLAAGPTESMKSNATAARSQPKDRQAVGADEE
jgi:putative DNA primase/helicase